MIETSKPKFDIKSSERLGERAQNPGGEDAF